MQIEKSRCKTCAHPQRRSIEIDFLFKDMTIKQLVEKWDISQPALHNHLNKHMSDEHKQELYAHMRLQAAEGVVEADRVDVVATLKKLSVEAELFLQQAKDDKDIKSGISVIKELRAQLELTARVMGDLGPQKPSNILVDHPEWQKVKRVMMKVLSDYPDAKAAFLEEIGYIAITNSLPEPVDVVEVQNEPDHE